jgi:hypothetical protein
MASTEDFYPWVTAEVLGCPDPVMDLAIKSTIIDFAEKSLVLQQDLDPITTIQNISDYDLEPPSDHLVIKIMKVWFKGQELDPESPDEIKTPSVYNRNSGYLVNKGDPRFYLQKDLRSISFYPVPSETARQSITIRVALKPTRAAKTFDDIFLEEYGETISHGALSRIYLSPDKTYTSDKHAMAHNSLYMAGLNVARTRAQNGNVRASRHVKMRRI